MLNVKTLSVRVINFERSPVSGANISLAPQNKDTKPIKLEWNEKTNLYSVTVNNTRGTFTLIVSAKGFDKQEREIKLPHPATAEEFVLGKKGMPFYYRGRVKTPFESKLDLIGVTIEARVKNWEQKIGKLAKKLKLSEVKTGEQIRNNNVLIFQHKAETPDNERQNILETLLQDEAVRLAGPVVELFEDRAVYLTSQLLVKFRPNVTPKLAEEYGKKHELRMVRTVHYIGNAYLFEAQPKADYSLLQTASALTESNDVIYAEPNSVTTSILYAINPSDFLVDQQWHIPLMNLPDAWQVLRNKSAAAGIMQGDPGDLTYGDENLVIAILDTGIRSSTTAGITTATHPEFSGTVTNGSPKIAAFYDFIRMVDNNEGLWCPEGESEVLYHGIKCAGLAAAQADNAAPVAGEFEGIAGAAGNCQLVSMTAPFGETDQRWADALVWMAGFDPGWTVDGTNYPLGTVFPALLAQGASILTCSARIPDVGLLDDTFDFLAAYGRNGRGVISFLAAGNTADDLSNVLNNTIADHDKVITITGSTSTDVQAGYCYDQAIDICAPTNNLVSTTGVYDMSANLAGHTGGDLRYTNFGGTSAATPLSAGVGALMLSVNPQLNWVQVREILRNTAVKIDATNTDPIGQWSTDAAGDPLFSQWYGYGRVDAAAAVEAARDYALNSDVVIRDSLGDTGTVPSIESNWSSPDIWVSTTDDPIPTLNYGDAPPHENPVRGQNNYVYMRVKNVGTAATNEVYLRVLVSHFPGFEFHYPENWQPSIPPSNPLPSPLVPGSYLIGEELIDNLAPGEDTIVKIQWDQDLIPPKTVMIGGMEVHWHPCLLAEVSPHDGPHAVNATLDVKRYNDLAQKNIAIDDVISTSGFSNFGVVAGSIDKIGVQSLILDRSKLRPDSRIFIYSEDPYTMKTWIELIRKGVASAAEALPWKPLREDNTKTEAHEYIPSGPGDCTVTLLEPAKLSIECADGKCMIIQAPRQTQIWPGYAPGTSSKPKVYVGHVHEKDVIFFDGDWGNSLELPMPMDGGQFMSLAIGVERNKEGSYGTLMASQRLLDGEVSVGYEIRG